MPHLTSIANLVENLNVESNSPNKHIETHLTAINKHTKENTDFYVVQQKSAYIYTRETNSFTIENKIWYKKTLN